MADSRMAILAWFFSATGVFFKPMSSPFLQNRRNLFLLSVGAFVVLVSTIGGIIFAVSVGSKPAQPEGLTTSSSDGNNQAGTQVFWTQVFDNKVEPEDSSSSSSSSSSASLSSSSSSSIEKEKKEVASPVKKPPFKKEANRPVTENESNDDEATSVTRPPGNKATPSKTRIIVIAVVVSVLVLLTIAAVLLYLFFFHWAPQPIPDLEPVPEPVQDPELEQPKTLSQSVMLGIFIVSVLIAFFALGLLLETTVFKDLVANFGEGIIGMFFLVTFVVSMTILIAFARAIIIEEKGPVDFLLMFLKAWADSN